MRAKTMWVLVVLALLTLTLSSCNAGGVSRPAQTQTAMAEAIGLPQTLAAGGTAVARLTQIALVPPTEIPTATAAPSATPPPTTAPPAVAPTVTARPTETPLPTVALPTPYPTLRPGPVVRISFQTGATSAVVDGLVAVGGQNRYRLRASAQQLMMLGLYSPVEDVYLAVRGETDGRTLLAADARSAAWQGQSPITQDYRITVYGGQVDAEYSLSVIIPRRISFKSGATSTRVQGNVAVQSTVTYLAHARGGQTMTVTITAPYDDVLLTIYGLEDGQPLVRAVSGATSWSGTLPGTQDYVIDVVGTDAARRYILDVDIE
jgi:hypothetical protein